MRISILASVQWREVSHRCHICTGTGLTAATSALGQDSPLPHLHRDWAHRCHICTGTALAGIGAKPAEKENAAGPASARTTPSKGLAGGMPLQHDRSGHFHRIDRCAWADTRQSPQRA